MTQPTATDDDPIRAERLANLAGLLTRIVNGQPLTPDEAKLLVGHIDIEIRESTTARELARRVPASTGPAAAGHPLVKGRCPACGGSSLFLGSGGYLTCARLDCPQPDAATEVIADFWDARQHGAFTFCAQEVGHVTMTAFARKITEKRTALAQREQSVRYANEQKQRAEQAEATIVQVRALRDDLRGITGARWIADALDKILDPSATGATERRSPVPGEDNAPDNSGPTIPDHQVNEGEPADNQADNPERCCVCGGSSVVYHNVNEQPFCWPCANCPCGQDVCVRTGINDPTVSPAAAERGRIASVLAEVLAAFKTTVRDEPGGRIVAYLAPHPIHPDDMDRWRAALSEVVPLTDSEGRVVCTCTFDTPCGCGTSVHYQPKEG